jgi:biopolymer transport protein ExbD
VELLDESLELSPAADVTETTIMPDRQRMSVPLQSEARGVSPSADDNDDDDPPPKRKRVEESAAIDLTPAVDVTFQLLIFFMVTASFSMQKAFDVPPAKKTDGVSTSVVVEQDQSSTAIKVQVDAENIFFIEETKKATSYRELLELLKAEKNASADLTDVELELHPDSTHEARIMVIDAATQAGFTRVKNKIAEW